MSKMAEISMQIEDLVEQGMSAKFIAVTLNVPMEWVETAIEERLDQEILKHHEMMSHAADLENFSPFDTINS
jgi:diacylglycerol kinase